MKKNKICLIVAASFAGLAVVSFLWAFIYHLATTGYDPTWVKINFVAPIVYLIIGAVVYAIPVVGKLVKENKKSTGKVQSDDEILAKYKSNKNK